MNEKKDYWISGQVTLYFVFMIMAIIVVLISAVFSPLGVLFNTEMYRAGEQIMLDSQERISLIQNETVKNTINSIVQGGLDNVQNNIDVNNSLFQYGWIAVLSLVLLVTFLFTRRLVEINQRTGLL